MRVFPLDFTTGTPMENIDTSYIYISYTCYWQGAEYIDNILCCIFDLAKEGDPEKLFGELKEFYDCWKGGLIQGKYALKCGTCESINCCCNGAAWTPLDPFCEYDLEIARHFIDVFWGNILEEDQKRKHARKIAITFYLSAEHGQGALPKDLVRVISAMIVRGHLTHKRQFVDPPDLPD